MKQKKYTKRALCMSILSMLLCCSMLIGTTFAWFTDSVTSGRNQIVAGNLDVELTHTNASVKDEPVDGVTELFKAADDTNILWEPGVVVYENFTVKNVGSLALKYILALNIAGKNTVTVEGEPHALDEVIQVATVKGGFDPDGRTDIESLEFSTLAAFYTDGVLLPTDKATDDQPSSEVFGVVLYWEPTDDDNIYNLNNGRTADDGTDQLYIDFGVDLQATQTPYESDSFDENYDATAEFPDAPFISAPFTDSGTPTPVSDLVLGNSALTVTVPDGAVTEEVTLKVIPTDHVAEGVTVASGQQAVSYDIELVNAAGEDVVLESPANVKLYLGKNLMDVTVYHDGVKVTDASYDAATGYVTFSTESFSPFDFVYYVPTVQMDGVNYLTLQDAVDAAKSGNTITILRSGEYDAIELNMRASDKNENPPTSQHLRYDRTITNLTIEAAEGVNAEIKGLTVVNGHINGVGTICPDGQDRGPAGYYASLNLDGLTLRNLHFTGKVYFAYWYSDLGSIKNVTFENCRFTLTGTSPEIGACVQFGMGPTLQAENVTVTGCIFENAYQGVLIGNARNARIEDCSFTNMGHNAIQTNAETYGVDGDIVIKNNTFKNSSDRAIRADGIKAPASFTVTGNTIESFCDGDGEVMKFTDADSGVKFDISSNTYEGKPLEDVKKTLDTEGDVIISKQG